MLLNKVLFSLGLSLLFLYPKAQEPLQIPTNEQKGIAFIPNINFNSNNFSTGLAIGYAKGSEMKYSAYLNGVALGCNYNIQDKSPEIILQAFTKSWSAFPFYSLQLNQKFSLADEKGYILEPMFGFSWVNVGFYFGYKLAGQNVKSQNRWTFQIQYVII